jgi:hypothetical protein
LRSGCRIENFDVIAACATVTQIQLRNRISPINFRPGELQVIAARNRELARFIANPREYPGDELLALMSQFGSCPTGRYMLARCLPGIPTFFKIKITDSPTSGPKKRKRRY